MRQVRFQGNQEFRLLVDVEQFNFKNQHLVGTDELTCAAFAVGEGGGNEEFELAADLHELQSFGPSGDHAADRESRGLAALDGAVEHRAVGERSGVVNGDGALFGRFVAAALLEDLVLESGSGGDDVFVLFVSGEEFGFLFLVFRAGRGGLFFGRGAEFRLEFAHEFHELLFADLRFFAVVHVGDARDCGFEVDFNRKLLEGHSDIHSETVAGLVAVVLKICHYCSFCLGSYTILAIGADSSRVSFFQRNLPVRLSGLARICSGVPAATMRPPSVPPPGPMSMMKSALRMTSRSCSMTRTVAPLSISLWKTARSVRTSRGCSPMVGSSKTKTASD